MRIQVQQHRLALRPVISNESAPVNKPQVQTIIASSLDLNLSLSSMSIENSTPVHRDSGVDLLDLSNFCVGEWCDDHYAISSTQPIESILCCTDKDQLHNRDPHYSCSTCTRVALSELLTPEQSEVLMHGAFVRVCKGCAVATAQGVIVCECLKNDKCVRC